MKQIIALLLIISLASCKKTEFDGNLTKDFSIQSISNGANYHIKVGLPENYNAAQKYATIYVLDGDDNFSLVAENCKKISGDYATSNVLVVSIGYGYDRAKDYTPTKAEEGDGGADGFMAFISFYGLG